MWWWSLSCRRTLIINFDPSGPHNVDLFHALSGVAHFLVRHGQARCAGENTASSAEVAKDSAEQVSVHGEVAVTKLAEENRKQVETIHANEEPFAEPPQACLLGHVQARPKLSYSSHFGECTPHRTNTKLSLQCTCCLKLHIAGVSKGGHHAH